MYKYLLLLAIICISLTNSAQITIEVNNPQRELRFVNLKSEENAPFVRHNREITKYVSEAIRNSKLQAYVINFSDGTDKSISIKEWEELNTYPESMELEGTTYEFMATYFHNDYTYIGIDQITGTKDGKEYSEYQYLSFYIDSMYSVDGGLQYGYSIKWNDLIQLLSNEKDFPLYYTNSYNGWWRGNVFLFHGHYAIDMGLGGDYIKLGQTHPSFKAENWRDKGNEYDLSIFHEKSYKGFPLEVFYTEISTDQGMSIKDVGVEYFKNWDYQATNDRFQFKWNDYLKIAGDSNWRSNSVVFSFKDALLSGKLAYSNNVKVVTLEIQNTPHPYFLTPSINTDIESSAIKKFKTDIIEGITMTDPLNSHLYQSDKGLIELIYKYAYNGQLPAYLNDSLTTPTNFKERASWVIDAKSFYYGESIIQKGDTVCTDDNKYFIAKQDYKGTGYKKAKDMSPDLWKPITLPLYPAKVLKDVTMLNRITFDENGLNKQYLIRGIGISIPYNINIKGIEIPICYVKWQDLKPLLLNDKKAMVTYQGNKVNIATLIESRTYFSYLWSTGYLEADEQ